MKLARLQLKLYAKAPPAFDPSALVDVFHTFIRDDKLEDELLIDVADYTHVHDGPGVVLIGHASDYYFDLGEGRPGLLYSRKREGPEDPAVRLEDAFRRALAAARQLEQESALKLQFATDEARVMVLDRLEASNDEQGFALLRPLLEKTLRSLYAELPFEIAPEGSPKEPLTVRVSVRGAPDVATLLERARATRGA